MTGKPWGEPTRVLGGWQHVPSVVTVIGPGGASRAEVRTHQQWAILPPDRPAIVDWEVMIIFPAHIEPYPVVFEDVEVAKSWTPDPDVARELGRAMESDWATDISWDPPNGPEQGAPKVEHHGSLVLFSGLNGTGSESYTVPPGNGVSDWPGRRPPGASVPRWMPLSFETTDNTDRINLYGHRHGKQRCDQHIYAVGKQTYNLPFPVLDAATSKY